MFIYRKHSYIYDILWCVLFLSFSLTTQSIHPTTRIRRNLQPTGGFDKFNTIIHYYYSWCLCLKAIQRIMQTKLQLDFSHGCFCWHFLYVCPSSAKNLGWLVLAVTSLQRLHQWFLLASDLGWLRWLGRFAEWCVVGHAKSHGSLMRSLHFSHLFGPPKWYR